MLIVRSEFHEPTAKDRSNPKGPGQDQEEQEYIPAWAVGQVISEVLHMIVYGR